MIKILENPNACTEKIVRCEDCMCKFSYTRGDIYKKQSMFNNGWEPMVVRCPNCGKEIPA